MNSPYSNLSEEDRLRQIAELLAIGAIRYLRRTGQGVVTKAPVPESNGPQIWDLVDDEVEKGILRYLSERIEAEPLEIRSALGFSAMTVTRRLCRLKQAGLISVSGRTRNARYGLAPANGRS